MPRSINEIIGEITTAAFEVHRILGPGLLQDAYLLSLVYELRRRSNQVKQAVTLPLVYKELQVERGYTVDLIVDDDVLVNVLAIERMLPIHTAKLMTMLKLSSRAAGMIINFNHQNLQDDISSVILAPVASR